MKDLFILEFFCDQCSKAHTKVALGLQEKDLLQEKKYSSDCCGSLLVFVRSIDVESVLGESCCGGGCGC